MLREFPLPRGLAPTAGGTGPATVPLRHAATVMLVRPASASAASTARGGGVEVFTFRRRPSHVFAAGMLVFPGGAVEAADDDAALPWSGPPPSSFAEALSADEALARAVVAGAVRETFEECGVLLAGPPDGVPLAEVLAADAGATGGPLAGEVWEARRRALVAGELTLGDLLRDAGLVLRADLLHPWAHWVTPPGERRRFDTRFFVAPLPAGQHARDLGGEGEHAAWVSPSAVLAGHLAGTVPMLPPTIVAMEELAAARSVEDLFATARRPRPVSPWVEADGTTDGGEPRYVLRIDLDGFGGGEPGPQVAS